VRKDFPLLDQAVVTVGTLSRGELDSALLALTPDELLRLRAVSLRYAIPNVIEAADLFQESVARALDGSRRCPADISVVKFLAEAMRSIADGERDKLKNRYTTMPLRSDYDHEGEVLDPPDPSPGVEETVINEESVAITYDKVLSLFQKGTPERDMVEGIMEGLSAEELRELLDLNKTAYNSMRRLVRRRINKAYPKGWSYDGR
jgi:DNA-directed RNA polymerase specialized sigma24 family protein